MENRIVVLFLVPIAANNSNLSGNPYPSALDANTFINDNLTSTTGTLYFWEHYSTNSSHVLVQYQGGYATRNLVGGTAPVAPSGISTSGSSSRVPGRYIPVGQGFFVNGSATGGTISFNNGQRAFIKENDAVNSNPLFRQTASSIVDNQFNNKQDAVPAETEFTKIRLGFDSANNFHRQLLLGFMDDKATSGIDTGYDATLLDIQSNDMYFLNTNAKLVIQGDSYFNTSSVFPLGVKTATEGKVKFTLDAIEKLDENQNVYIYDNVTSTYHDIRNQAFEVNLPAGTISDRFSLRFKTTSTLGVDNFGDSQTIAVAFTNNNNSINIKNDVLDRTVKTVTLYNILGQSIRTWDIKNENQSKIEIPVTNVSSGTYIVKVHTTKGDVNKKIIIK
ncbi:MAG: T9SS type A sorting domain-containing protein [Flavobacterium sp.]|nr:T9SS type A sorting domain-containing protein [Flavobacterium sp.]